MGRLVEFEINDKKRRKVLKLQYSENLGSDYPADRAQSLILSHHAFNDMPNHVKSLDVLGLSEDGEVLPVGKAKEYFLLMDEAKGVDYFKDLKRIAAEGEYDKNDERKILILAKFLADLHKKKFKSESLYKRKIRDTIGGGASIMGVFDMYPERVDWFLPELQAEIVKKAVDHWSKERYFSGRLCEIHGDFHPGNIWFKDAENFTILDRSRGRYGEAADDISAFLINFIFYSLIYKGEFSGPLFELFQLFVNEYFKLTDDEEMGKVISPFWAFRVVVVCNPHPFFYPDSFYGGKKKALDVRMKMISFALNVLDEEQFDWKRIDDYLRRL